MVSLVIRYSSDARFELDELYFWISVDTGPNAATKAIRRLDRAVQNLAAFPQMGVLHPEWSGAPRAFSVHPWVLIYQPLDGRRGIEVLRVLDGRRDLNAVLSGSD